MKILVLEPKLGLSSQTVYICIASTFNKAEHRCIFHDWWLKGVKRGLKRKPRIIPFFEDMLFFDNSAHFFFSFFFHEFLFFINFAIIRFLKCSHFRELLQHFVLGLFKFSLFIPSIIRGALISVLACSTSIFIFQAIFITISTST